jgi:hypothetical protein
MYIAPVAIAANAIKNVIATAVAGVKTDAIAPPSISR